MSTKIDIVNGLVACGYVYPPSNFSRKNLSSLIKEGLKQAGCNLIITNVPTFSKPREGTELEKVDTNHIFETLVEFGNPITEVIQITENSYMVYATDADDIANRLDRMCIDTRVIRVTYYPLAFPLVLTEMTNNIVKKITQMSDYVPEDLVTPDNSGTFSFIIVVFLAIVIAGLGIYF